MAWTDPTRWAWVLLLSEWAIRLALLVIVPFRRSPAAAKGWLLLIFFEPWLGLVLYFVISIGYSILLEWRWRGQTVGKRLFGLRVIDVHGLRLQPAQIVLRAGGITYLPPDSSRPPHRIVRDARSRRSTRNTLSMWRLAQTSTSRSTASANGSWRDAR